MYHVVLRASGQATFPDKVEDVVSALQKAYKNRKDLDLPNCFDRQAPPRKPRFKINPPGIVFNGESLQVRALPPSTHLAPLQLLTAYSLTRA